MRPFFVCEAEHFSIASTRSAGAAKSIENIRIAVISDAQSRKRASKHGVLACYRNRRRHEPQKPAATASSCFEHVCGRG